MATTEVLIVGAGPTGLVLALWLAKQGVRPRIIDKSAASETTSRALAVQARTLELYRQLDLADDAIDAGHKSPGVNFWVRGERKAHLAFGDAGADLTPYPFVLMFPQDQHERLLIDRLAKMGIAVERETEMVSFEERDDAVAARLRRPDGSEEVCDAKYLAGCDGARSITRHTIGAQFPGGTYKQTFYVADADIERSAAIPGEINLSFDNADFVLLMSYGESGKCRLIGAIHEETTDTTRTFTFDDVSHRAMESLGVRVKQVNWFSTYRVHHRVADHFQKGRAFLLGDAAHIHSPAGGQGMNTGIGDAINLAWKLAAVIRGAAPATLLGSYEVERAAFARTLVETTDRVFSFATAHGSFAEFVRTRIMPLFLKTVYHFDDSRAAFFRVLSQTMLNYHESPLSVGKAGEVCGGDRLPWLGAGGLDNYAPLNEIKWQAHVYGAAGDPLRQWCETRAVPLRAFPWSKACDGAGLQRDAAYLIRPDTYVAVADAKGDPRVFEEYFASRSIETGPAAQRSP